MEAAMPYEKLAELEIVKLLLTIDRTGELEEYLKRKSYQAYYYSNFLLHQNELEPGPDEEEIDIPELILFQLGLLPQSLEHVIPAVSLLIKESREIDQSPEDVACLERMLKIYERDNGKLQEEDFEALLFCLGELQERNFNLYCVAQLLMEKVIGLTNPNTGNCQLSDESQGVSIKDIIGNMEQVMKAFACGEFTVSGVPPEATEDSVEI